jgi:hypothetical protein
MNTLTITSASLFLVTASMLAGGPLDEAAFSLRFPTAISRFASYADVAAEGGAQAASEWVSSNNPASAAWPKETPPAYDTSFSPQFSLIGFGSGNHLYVTAEAVNVNAGKAGFFIPAAAQVYSNHEQLSNGLGYRFDAQFYQLQWGKLVAPKWTVGGNFNLTVSDTRFDLDGTQVARSRAESYDFRVGIVHQLLPRLRIGMIADYAFAPSRNDTLTFDPATFTLRNERTYDKAHQFLLRPGLVFRYAPGCDLYVDYQLGYFEDASGTLTVHRFPIGVEHTVIKNILFLRAGTLIDTEGNISATAGFGISLGTRASLDAAYQYDMLPELRPEFGVAQTMVISLAIGF